MTRWLSMGKAMQTLGVCRKTMRRYCLSGIVEAEKLPSGHWRIKEESLAQVFGETSQAVVDLARRAGLSA